MSNNKYLVFDFDGTIADSMFIWFKIYNQLAPEFDALPFDLNELDNIKNMSLAELSKTYHISPIKFPLIIDKVKQKMRFYTKDLHSFDDLPPVLQKLQDSGYHLGILTSNSQENVRSFLQNNQMAHLFEFIYTGKNLFGKDQVIRRLLKTRHISINDLIYIGDEIRDIKACHQVGVPIISVSWGYNSHSSLSLQQPNILIDHPSKLLSAVFQLS